MVPRVFLEGSRLFLALAVVLAVSVGLGGAATNDTLEGKHTQTFTIFEGEDLTVNCRSHAHFTYWTNKNGFYKYGKTLCIKNISLNYTGYYYCFEKLAHHSPLEQRIYVKVQPVRRYSPVEGQIFIAKASTSSRSAYWTNKRGFYKRGSFLYFFSINRRFTGWFYCYKTSHFDRELVEKIFIDVEYPAQIMSISRIASPLNESETFSLKLRVEGHPDPTTTFTSVYEGDVKFRKSGEGSFDVDVKNLQCADGGPYRLNVENDIGRDTSDERILVLCPPALRSKVKDKFEPRLGDTVALTVRTMGYPYPEYTWTFGGDVVANSTGDDTDELDIRGVTIGDFGVYKLTMTNEYGSSTQKFRLTADGPPDPVTDIAVKKVTENSVDISFVSGYDYEDWQNFIIIDSNGDEIETFKDKAKKHRPTKESHVVKGLKPGTTYNFTIIANNSRGESEAPVGFLVFTTDAPNKPLVVMEGQNVSLSCENADNMTDVHWETADGNRTGDNDTLDFVDVSRDESGLYRCAGMSESGKRRILEEVTVDVQYPARILNVTVEDNYLEANDTFTMVIVVEGNPPPITTFVKNRDGEVGYEGTGSGEFNVTMEMMECPDQGVYTLTSSNKRGNDTHIQTIFVYCPPVVDKKANIKNKFTPRLGSKESLIIQNYGYPYPSYTWRHGDTTILKHEDSDFSSTVTMDVAMDTFGEYFVDVKNDLGLLDYSFQVLADGPPDPIANITVESVSQDTVTISWLSGFNYGKPQTFTVYKILDGQYTAVANVTDDSEKGMTWMQYVVTGLSSAMTYQFTVRAFNDDGYSDETPGSDVNVTTSAAPEAQKGDKLEDGEIAGVVIGAVAFVAILVAVGVFLRKRGNRRAIYQEIAGE